MKKFCGFWNYMLGWTCMLLATTQPGSTQDANGLTPVSCGIEKECTPRKLCDNSNKVIRDGRALVDFRSIESPRNGREKCGIFEECCSVNDKRTAPIVNEKYVPGLCGARNKKGVSITIENAQHGESQFAEFPWMVAIQSRATAPLNSYASVGGGSLLSPHVVLSAAHIFKNLHAKDLRVRAGEWDTKSENEELRHQDREVADLIIHEKFNDLNGIYDTALLILHTPFQLDWHIGTICLPSPEASFESSRCTVTGWGKRSSNDKDYPNILKNIELPFVERNKCENQLRYNTRLGRYFELHESFVCAGGERDRDACFGDGGAPLVCPMTNGSTRYQLVGMVSWGLDCGTENVPGVYTNVQEMIPWIMEHLKLHSITI
ncbi:hypothetical protein AWZ03_010830 [Drosophila navojoa]|uniref:Phenoloxidase-activating factor 2 n=1 Tax=Drosophila navojoa TaxID=7232 RepID=A0A484B388_DRONA|nr:phenoloxidase-activating factor 2-like [Drosophila navojoa]TDG42752.1 hypothetical protein AWZ03_010830 [Drosophila navojoa]